MSRKLINIDLNEEQLALANWFIEETSEFRQSYDENDNPELLAFIYPSDLDELGKLLQDVNYDFFTDGAMDMSFNGGDVVIDIISILEYELEGLDPKVIYPEWKQS